MTVAARQNRRCVSLGNRAIPAAVIPRDRQVVIARAASVAHQPLLGHQQNRDVGNEHEQHRDQDRGRRGQAEGADRRTGEGEHHHEARDLRERLGSKKVVTAAEDAPPQVLSVIEGGVPVEEDLAKPAMDVHPGRSADRIDLDPADLPALGVVKLDPHSIRIAAGLCDFTKNLPALPRPRLR